MCIPEIETKLKGFSTFQTQAFPVTPIFGGGEFGAGVGFKLQFSFYVKWAFLLHPGESRQQVIKVAKSYLACRPPWTISLFWGVGRGDIQTWLFLTMWIALLTQLKIWRSNQDGDNNRWILGSSFSVQKHFCLSWIFFIFETRWIINTFLTGLLKFLIILKFFWAGFLLPIGRRHSPFTKYSDGHFYFSHGVLI